MTSLKGNIRRKDRLMLDADAESFLISKKVAHVGTVDKDGFPYVIPLLFIYQGGNELYLHTGNHEGHFYNNLLDNPKTCIEVEQMGNIKPGESFACDSSMAYTSVILFGKIKVIDDEEKKTWFFDELLKKYGEKEWKFEKGYPFLKHIRLYCFTIEKLTGKCSDALHH